jgi:predicted nucleic acid-binding protein
MRPSTGSSPLPKLFIDTWGWLALANDQDPAYEKVAPLQQQYLQGGQAWVTTDYVLDETITRLFAARPFAQAEAFCSGILAAQQAGSVILELITSERFQSAYRLRLRYRDKPRISFTDLTSVVVMRELGIRRVLTGDAHFTQVHLGFQVLP